MKKSQNDKNWKSLYVMNFGDNLIKIGVSKDVETRKHVHEKTVKKKCLELYSTEMCSNPFLLEKIIIEHFSEDACMGNEWIKNDYEKVVDYVKNVFEIHAKNNVLTEEVKQQYIKKSRTKRNKRQNQHIRGNYKRINAVLPNSLFFNKI